MAKVVIVGDSDVGKTSIISLLVGEKLEDDKNTVGIDFKLKDFVIKN